MNNSKLPKKIESCECDCNSEKPSDPSRRDFMKQATTLTMIGSTAFILQACGGGGSSPTGPQDPGGGDNNGGGDNTDTGYTYDATTGTITIDTSMIYTTLQTAGNGIQLSGSDTFDSRGIIVLRTSNTGVRALSRRCTHANNTVNINSAGNNLLCPSHNSIFDLNGNAVSGPATGALTSYTCSLDSAGTIITIQNS
ncbi:MAG: Rieske (2Fe-2S) protein [Candidatus Marinimicrobia bacterium]|jgi:cytochrome b6-f complex iron-sulfur subunit|nr:Rieske (2Fe-2S) protein [Candidatus Neomarinimicrobiota bacterium]